MESEFIIGKFKAKYGVSYITLANLLNISAKTSREWSETETAPEHIKKLIKKIDNIMENCIREGNLLSDSVPYIQGLKHQIEIRDKKIASFDIDNRNLRNKLNRILYSSWKTRLIFLFRPGSINKN